MEESSLLEGLPLILMGEVGALGADGCVVTAGGREEIGGGCLDLWLCLISHVIRAISATWPVHGQSRDQCMISFVISS